GRMGASSVAGASVSGGALTPSAWSEGTGEPAWGSTSVADDCAPAGASTTSGCGSFSGSIIFLNGRRGSAGLGGPHRPEDPDGTEIASLVDLHALQPDELQDGEEGDDH